MRSRRSIGSTALVAACLGVSTVFALAGLMFAFSSAAGAALATPLVSTATSDSGGGTVGNGTVLTVTFSATPVLAGSYSLTLTDGSTVDTLSSAAGTLSASVSGMSIAFTVHGGTSLSLSLLEILGSTGVNDASGNPWDLIASGQVDKSYVLSKGDQVTVNYNEPVTVASSYSLTLSEGSGSAVIDNTNSSVSGGGTATLVFTLTGSPSGSVAADGPLVTASTGITATPPLTVTSDSVTVALSTTCSAIAGYTRVFGGSNCAIGFGQSGPTSPDVYDVIPLPTQDLPGPPDDSAPEVITSCQLGSTSDVVYDVNTGAELGANACGNNPPEQLIGNTNSNTLDYIPTPNLVSFQEVGVVETIPGSSYVSATSVPPQLSAIAVSGNQATFSYFENVVCQASSSDFATWSQFTYVTPYTKTTLVPGDLVYPTAIACPASGGGTSITLTYANPVPFSSGLRFKFVGYGPGHFIVGAPGSAFANEREASQSAYAGPTATVDSFTPPSTTLASSSGGTVDASFATTAATMCSISAVSLPAGAAALTLPSVASCNGTGAIGVPANTSTTTNVVYTVTLTAPGVPGTPAASGEITITVPAAPPPTATTPTTPIVTPPTGGKRPKAPNTRLVFKKVSSKNHSATFRFKATGKWTGFRCALVRKPTRKGAKTPKPKYVVCGSSKTFKHLKAGSFVLYVRAIGPGGVDKSPATYKFKIT